MPLNQLLSDTTDAELSLQVRPRSNPEDSMETQGSLAEEAFAELQELYGSKNPHTTKFTPEEQTQLLNEMEDHAEAQYNLNPVLMPDGTPVPFSYDADIHEDLDDTTQAQLLNNQYHATYRVLQFPHARNGWQGHNPWMADYAQWVAVDDTDPEDIKRFINISSANVNRLCVLWSAIQNSPEKKFIKEMNRQDALDAFFKVMGEDLARGHQGDWLPKPTKEEIEHNKGLSDEERERIRAQKVQRERDCPTCASGIQSRLIRVMQTTLIDDIPAPTPADIKQSFMGDIISDVDTPDSIGSILNRLTREEMIALVGEDYLNGTDPNLREGALGEFILHDGDTDDLDEDQIDILNTLLRTQDDSISYFLDTQIYHFGASYFRTDIQTRGLEAYKLTNLGQYIVELARNPLKHYGQEIGLKIRNIAQAPIPASAPEIDEERRETLKLQANTIRENYTNIAAPLSSANRDGFDDAFQKIEILITAAINTGALDLAAERIELLRKFEDYASLSVRNQETEERQETLISNIETMSDMTVKQFNRKHGNIIKNIEDLISETGDAVKEDDSDEANRLLDEVDSLLATAKTYLDNDIRLATEEKERETTDGLTTDLAALQIARPALVPAFNVATAQPPTPNSRSQSPVFLAKHDKDQTGHRQSPA